MKIDPLSLGKTHLGQRVSMLYRIADDNEFEQSEAVGVLQACEGEDGAYVYTILKRNGIAIKVGQADILSVKLIPPKLSS